MPDFFGHPRGGPCVLVSMRALCDDCAEALTILYAALLEPATADVECPDWVLCVALGMSETSAGPHGIVNPLHLGMSE